MATDFSPYELAEKKEKRLFAQWITIGLIFVTLCVVIGMVGCPVYNVYAKRKQGEAALAEAQYSRQVAVAEAKAKMESASLLADADTIRAHGIASSNRIIGQSLENNPAYLSWLFIDNLKDTKDQIIYIPSGNMGLPLLEANRFTQKAPVIVDSSNK